MNRRVVVGVAVLAFVAVGALLTTPAAALERLTWLAADPIRFGAALLLLAAVRPLLAWPTTLIAVAVGYGYGWIGVPFGVLLLTLTALPPYWFALAGRGDGTGRIAGVAERVADATGEARVVAASRLLPTPSDAVSLASGAAGVRLRPFVLGTAVGELPWVIAGVAVGISADRLLTGDLTGFDPAFILAFACVGVLLIAGPAYRSYRSMGERPLDGA